VSADDIRSLYRADPFAPFQLVLAGGREILVAKREHLSIAVTGDRVVICPRIEDFEIVNLADVNGVRLFGAPVSSVQAANTSAA
jgi:hypothetical protein